MAPMHSLVARDVAHSTSLATLVLMVLALVTTSAVLACVLVLFRRRRRNRVQSRTAKTVADDDDDDDEIDNDDKGKAENAPLYDKRRVPKQSRHRRLTISATPYGKHEFDFVTQEKQNLVANSSSPPPSPVPEIRITFPDECDASGKRQSGRVVVVRVGEHGIGLGPVEDELPRYEHDESSTFQSVDLERIGGLKEKRRRG